MMGNETTVDGVEKRVRVKVDGRGIERTKSLCRSRRCRSFHLDH